MASITEILGTDSISSSRPVINSNFQLINDEIGDIQTLINPTTTSIQGISSATVESLNVIDNNTNIATFATTGININVDVEFNSRVRFAGEISKTGIEGSATSPTTTSTPGSLTESTYFINTNFTLPAGISGQEVTLINVDTDSVAISAVAGIGLGATSISLDGNNSTVTLRYIDSVWYVISSHAATIS